jgi:Protein of unknown function (DUF2505)
MQYRKVHTYTHTPDEVLAALTDFAVMKAKYEALGHTEVTLVERVERDGAVSVTTKRTVPLDVPGFAKKVLKPTNTVVQTDAWEAPDAAGVRQGHFTVDAKGVPVTMGGALRLAPAGTGAEQTIDVTVTCKLPLIGGKIADFVGGDAKKAVDHDGSFTKQHLGEG